MGMLGSQEILLIFVAIVLLFGASKLPDLARSMGRSMGEFKRGQVEIENELQSAKNSAVAPPGTDMAFTRIQRMAQNLGIDVSGKTDDQLLVEIDKKISR
ncbi:MAG: twin-arginine translocase TatA/TatE family subunit [Methanocella sp.]